MLSDDEQRAWVQIERSLAAAPPGERHLLARALTRVGGGLAALLLLTGVPSAALAIGLATAVGWATWRLSRRSVEPLPDPVRVRARLRRIGTAVEEHLSRMAESQWGGWH